MAMSMMAMMLAVALGSAGNKTPIVSPDKFVVTYWYGVPPEETTPQRYAEIAEAGFNLVTPSPTTIWEQCWPSWASLPVACLSWRRLRSCLMSAC